MGAFKCAGRFCYFTARAKLTNCVLCGAAACVCTPNNAPSCEAAHTAQSLLLAALSSPRTPLDDALISGCVLRSNVLCQLVKKTRSQGGLHFFWVLHNAHASHLLLLVCQNQLQFILKVTQSQKWKKIKIQKYNVKFIL
jgi:hypothetical protein